MNKLMSALRSLRAQIVTTFAILLLAPGVAFADSRPPVPWWSGSGNVGPGPYGMTSSPAENCANGDHNYTSVASTQVNECHFTGVLTPYQGNSDTVYGCSFHCTDTSLIDGKVIASYDGTGLADVGLNYFCEPGFAQSGSDCVRASVGDPDKNKGMPNCCEGNPINATVGNKFQKEVDYIGTGPFPLVWIRSYNSFGNKPGTQPNIAVSSSLGWTAFDTRLSQSKPSNAWTVIGSHSNSTMDSGWRHTYDRAVKAKYAGSQAFATVFGPDSKTRTFKMVNGAWVAETGEVETSLVRFTDSNGAVIGWKYTNEDDEVESYDATGKLLSIQNRAGLVQTLHYNAKGQLDSIADPAGRTLTLTYNAKGYLDSMTDPANRMYAYTYDAAGNLAKVTYPDNQIRQYVYGDSHYTNALTGIIDENGARFATWAYDNQGRAISSEHAGGVEKVTLSFGTGTITVNAASGVTRTYTSQIVNGVVQAGAISEACGTGCGRSISKTYDANGNVASRTDFNGNKTCYAYDLTRNVETARVEGLASSASCATALTANTLTAPARKITTEWHPTYRLPTKIAEPKRLTINEYDAKGNLLKKTEQATTDTTGAQGFNATPTSTPRQWQYTYNAYGQVLTAKGPRTDLDDTTTYTYDSTTGNLLTVKNAAGLVTKFGNYDAHGRVGRITDPNGLVTDLTYYPRGWLKAKTVTGNYSVETTTYEYDNAGQLTQVTLPDSVLHYRYDDAHRLTDISDSLGNSIHYTLDAMGNRTKEEVKDPSGTLARQVTRVFDALSRLQQVTGAAQ